MNGKISINIGGQTRSLFFGMDALELFYQITEKAPAKTSTMFAKAEVYAGLMGHCNIALTQPDFTYEDVAMWVEDLLLTDEGKAIIKQVDDCFADSKAYKSMLPDEGKQGAKKK